MDKANPSAGSEQVSNELKPIPDSILVIRFNEILESSITRILKLDFFYLFPSFFSLTHFLRWTCF